MMVNGMADIDRLILAGALSNEEHKKGLSKKEIKNLKLFTYSKVKAKEEEDTCSVCLVATTKGDRVY
jgi:hypothetical protein